MPQPDTVRDFVSELLGKTVDVRAAPDLDVERDDLYTGLLVDDDKRLAALVIADLAFASITGGCLVMVPAATVSTSIASAELSESLRENYYEIANILTGLVNGPTVAHIRINELVDGVPSEARDLIMRAAGRRTYDVTIPGYGDGSVALFAE